MLSPLERFAELANFVSQLGQLRFDPLVLLSVSPIVFELQGVQWNVVVVVFAGFAAAPATVAAALLALAAEDEAVAAAEGRGDLGRLVVSQDGQLGFGTGLKFFDGRDEGRAGGNLLAVDLLNDVAGLVAGAGRGPRGMKVWHNGGALVFLV